MNNLDPKGEFNFILQELKATNQNNQLKKMRENQKALECLEDVKKYACLHICFTSLKAQNDFYDYIDQKISELKGE